MAEQLQPQAPAPTAPGQGPQMPFTGIMQNEPNQLLAQITRPAQSPEEVIERKGLWQTLVEKINTDPNLQNAMLMMGTNLMQPIGAGQNPAGHVGQALAAGTGVYKAGEYSQYQQQAQQEESGRRERESQATIGKQKAETAAVTQATDLARQLEQSQVERGRLEVDSLRTRIGTARTEQEIRTIEADLLRRKADIEKSIPDETLRRGRIAEIEKLEQELNESKARASNYQAAAGLSRAKTTMELKEIEALPTDPREMREYLSKTGRYASSTTSGIVQQAAMWGDLYDKLPADDTDRKGKTREQYIKHMLKTASQKSVMESYLKAVQYLAPDDPMLDILRQAAQASLDQGGQAPEAAAGDGKVEWTTLPNGWKRAVKKDGTIILQRPESPGPGAARAGAAAAGVPVR